MRDAWSACRDPGAKNDDDDNHDAMDAWDRAAALLLGSGRLSPYDLGQSYCQSFGTCDDQTGVAETNRMMVDLIYAGRGALIQDNTTKLTNNDSHCDVVMKLSTKVQALVLVPMIQATLKSTLDAARERTSKAMAHAFVSSRAILPLIQELNPSIATRLTELVNLTKQHQVAPNTGALVMDLLSQVYEDMNVDCDWIGRLGEYNPCESNNAEIYASSQKHGLSTGGWVAITLSFVTGTIIAYFCWRRKRVQKRRSSNVSMMVESNPTLETLPEYDAGDAHPTSPSSVSSAFRSVGRLSSMVEKNRSPSAHSESTMDTMDLHMITNSFQRSTSRLSSKADRTLNRIMSYGDDDESAVVDEEWVLQRKLSQKESGSMTGMIISKGNGDD